jgi:superfamily II DNA/RNA helicase
VVADQSGSGKTLAYLVPVIQQIKEQEHAAGRLQTQSRKPRAVVLCPTEELCVQVLLTCRALSQASSSSPNVLTYLHYTLTPCVHRFEADTASLRMWLSCLWNR